MINARTCTAVLLMFSLTLAPDAVFAQDTPVVFLHGFGAQPSDWAATAARLHDRVAITPLMPLLQWRNPFMTQGRDLQADPAYASLPNSTVAIGHSNGGIVAREWSRLHRLNGIITLGTPHRGAPILPHFQDWVALHNTTPPLLNRVLSAFMRPSNWSWISYSVQPMLDFTSYISLSSVYWVGLTLGLDGALPVAADMTPGSAYLSTLNGSGNLDREAASVPNRVGIVSVAHNFYFAGAARAIVPDVADQWATALYATASGLLYWSNYIMVQADPTDIPAMEQSFSMLGVAGHLLSMDPFYCKMVSRADWSACLPNDGVVPDESQRFPNAPNIVIGLSNDGPAHKQEKDWGTDVLYDALVWYTHVPPRTATPPPPPPPPPPVDTPPPPPPAPTGSDVLRSGAVLHGGEIIDSQDGRFHLIYQLDGNLVLYDQSWSPLWASDTAGTAPGIAGMQGDGNFVIYDANWTPLWASDDSNGHPGAYLIVQDDGNVVIYDLDGTALWATYTAR